MATRTDFVQPQAGSQGFARTGKVFGRRVSFATTDLALNAVVEAFMVPAGFTVTGVIAVTTDMDSNGSPTLQLSVGDSGSSVRFLAAANNLGQAAATVTTLAAAGLLYTFTADTKILVTATTASATAVAGTVDLYLQGFMQ
jgi:hypothetical protein